MNFQTDDRFPKLLRTVIGRLDFIAIPNLALLIVGLSVLAFVATNMLEIPLERFVFDPTLVKQGEWWRLFAYPTMGATGGGSIGFIWMFFFVLYIYFVINALEQNWGPAPLTIFTLFSYATAIAASLLTDRSISVWYYVIENVSLAFGTIFPEVTFFLFFVIPVRAKWLAMLFGAFLCLQLIFGSWDTRLIVAITFSPYLIFFGYYLTKLARKKLRR